MSGVKASVVPDAPASFQRRIFVIFVQCSDTGSEPGVHPLSHTAAAPADSSCSSSSGSVQRSRTQTAERSTLMGNGQKWGSMPAILGLEQSGAFIWVHKLLQSGGQQVNQIRKLSSAQWTNTDPSPQSPPRKKTPHPNI